MNQNTMICNNCKTPNPPQNLYCQSCGRPLIPASPAAPAADPSQLTQVPPAFPPPAQPGYPAPQMPPPGYGANPGYPQNPLPPQGYQANPPPQQAYPGANPPPSGYQQQGYQGGYYQAPPMPPRPFAAPKLDTLGVKVDGWIDVLPGSAEKAGELENAFLRGLSERKQPNSKLSRIEFAVGMTSRPYQVYNTASGAILINFTPLGHDLQVSWDLYLRQKPNWLGLGLIGGVPLALSFFQGLVNASLSMGVLNFGVFLVNWLWGTLNLLLLAIVIGLIAGKIHFGNFFHFYVTRPELPAQQELGAMAIVVQQVLKKTLHEAGVDLSELKSRDG